jgi:PTH1 family peptidyl-tRNA hydrolase
VLFGKKATEALDGLIIGLGNPGARYAGTRHNLGWWVLDELAKRHKPFKSGHLHKAAFDYLRINCGALEEPRKVALIKPATFMNLSGQAVKPWLKTNEGCRFIVAFDDFSLETAKIRLRDTGSAGGHNGVKSLIACLGSQDFLRLKVGVGSPRDGQDPGDYVLEEPSRTDKPQLAEAVQRAADILERWACGAEIEELKRMAGEGNPKSAAAD